MRIAIGLLGAVTLLAYLDRLSWFFELGKFLRVQYAVLLLLLALVAAARRQGGERRRRGGPRGAEPRDGRAALDRAGRGEATRTRPRPVAVRERGVSNHEHSATIDYLRALPPDVIGITEFSPQWRDALRPVTRLYGYRVEAVRPDAYGIGTLPAGRSTRKSSPSRPTVLRPWSRV